uniref:Integrin alpha-2 domain-containing protein n=1 Tax=Scophthalmus maximus TaxID=52904 RepID=A0A8D3CGW6_SCOMX
MAKHWHIVYLCSVCLVYGAAFNLDTENVLQRRGDPGTLFGFSVAFHQQLSPVRKNLLLVGAPRSEHQNQGNVTGVVYQCDLTSTSERCQPIEFNNFLDSKGINGQWMGVRVTSQGPGQNVMTCAHRYQQWSPSPGEYVPRLVTGQCYVLGDDLKVGKEERDWRRVVCDSDHLIRRRKDHEWFAYCQQGHGAAFAKDNRSLLFGAPGAYLWKGIVRMELLDNLEMFSDDPRETGDIDLFKSELIPLQRDSYLGFSIDSGMALIRKGELTIVSGAPRGGYSGQVTFLKADPVAKRSLSVEVVLSGPGLASSFGYDVAVVDFNGDGWEDLAVGAPQFCDKEGLVGGAAYVYINKKGKNWEDVVPTQLLGHRESMFGLAVESIGDINQDGYGDIAVGAPYDGSGRVYVYCGSSDGIDKKPAQVLSPGSKNNLFGYSLSGNLDVDDNQYPDLAVGSLSDSNTLIRIRTLFQPDVRDRLHNIPVSVTVALLSSAQTRRTSKDLPNVAPVLNLYERRSTVSEVVLMNRGCGSDNVCQSNLQLEYKFCSRKTQNGRNVFKSLAREDGVAVITPSEEDTALEITVTNRNGDDAHQSHSIIVLPSTLHYSSIIYNTAETQMSCTANEKGTLIDCELGNPLQRDADVSSIVTFYVVLTTTGISLSTTYVNVTLQLVTTSVQTIQPVEALAKVVFELELQVYGLARPSQVSLGEKVMGESAIKAVDEIGTRVQYQFRIANLGRPLKYFANASLNINWPKENSVGKWLLYLSQITSEGVQSVSCSPVDEVNPLKHVKVSNPSSFCFSWPKATCSDGLRCVEVRCPLVGLDSDAVMVLHAHLWNTTLTEVIQFLLRLLLRHRCPQVKLTVFFERKTKYFTKVAWWIIFLTVVALLLLLAGLGFLLWKVKS